MKKLIIVCALLSCLIQLMAQKNSEPFKTFSKFKLPIHITQDDYLPKTIIFKVSPKFRGVAEMNTVVHPQLQLALNFLGIKSLSRKFPNHKAPEKETNRLGQKFADLSLIYELNYIHDIDIERAINQLMASGALTYAEPHYIYPLLDYQPNDPRSDSVLGNQRNAFKRIRAYKAWDVNLGGSKGDPNTIIAIVDSGSDLDHPDLAANIYKNNADPINGNDDDNDGYIDNYNGWDLAGSDFNNLSGDNDPNCKGQNNTHGSHVSGCASQASDNGEGGAGVGFNCKLLIVKASADNDTRASGGAGYVVKGYEGITYAADHGAHIINCSWGGSGGGDFGQDIIDYATINKNALVIAAAGNNSQDIAFYPASYNYVLSVAASNSTNDGKATFSNYNYAVDLSAPGTQIDATIYDNSYTAQSGTSMASPIVAGAAGLVKSKFPGFTALQIAERLKRTTDNNYLAYHAVTNPNITNPAATSSALKNKLGSGRLNVYRALIDPIGSSLAFQNEKISDQNDMAFVVNDTLFISGEFVNYLAKSGPATKATLKALVNSNFVTAIDSVFTIGELGSLSTVNNHDKPFKFKIENGAPLNTEVTFGLEIKDGTYSSTYFFSITVNVDYINITINDLQTTITSNGKFGWNKDGATEGLGCNYLGTQMLYEGSLMIGTSSSMVSDCFRGTNTNNSDQDFAPQVNVNRTIPSVYSEFDASGSINDAAALTSLNLSINQNTYAWSIPGHRKYVILEYLISNNGSSTLNNLFAGLAADWDIDAVNYAKNKSSYDTIRKMGYSWLTDINGKYGALKVLSADNGNFYAIDNVAGGNGGVDINDAGDYFGTADKYKTLSTARYQGGMKDADGEDVLNVMSTGPISIGPQTSHKVAFALICGDNVNDIQNSADSAQSNYDKIIAPIHLQEITATNRTVTVFPNPAQHTICFYPHSNDDQIKGIEIINQLGETIKEIKTAGNESSTTIAVTDLAAGMYFYRIHIEQKNQMLKIETGKLLKKE